MQLIPVLTLLLAAGVSLSHGVFTVRDPMCVCVRVSMCVCVFVNVCECVLGWCIEMNWEGTANLYLLSRSLSFSSLASL